MRRAADINESIVWQDMTTGCEIAEAGTSVLTKTGEWRSKMPVWKEDKCRQCLMCAPFCPDSSIPVSGGKRLGFDLDHCKGCGICQTACPFDAIEMKEVH